MSLTPRDLAILRMLRRYFYLRTNQIRDALIAHDDDGAITRSRLRKLAGAGYVRKYQPKLVDELGTTPPVFVLTLKGSSALVAACDDASLLLTNEPKFDDWMSLNHFCGLSSFHILLDRAFASQTDVVQQTLHFEHEVVCPEGSEPAKKYRLYTVVCESPRVVCVPDSVFETEYLGYRRAWYVERETGSETPARVAAKKAKGYAGLFGQQLYKRHCPLVQDFRVLAVCPSPAWRDALRREMGDKPGAELWLFGSQSDFRDSNVLNQPVWYKTIGPPLPLIPARVPAFSSAPDASSDVVPEGRL